MERHKVVEALVCRVLEKYLRGEVSATEVERWAEAVEGRVDLEYIEAQAEQIDDALFRLSTPEINVPLSSEIARTWVRTLSAL